MKKLNASLFPALVLFIALVMANVLPSVHTGRGKVSAVQPLPVVGSFENFKVLLSNVQQTGYSINSGMMRKSLAPSVPAAGISEQSAKNAADYSTTNVQVEGVDEADVVKTDGRYIYQVNNQRVVIAGAYPAAEMKIETILEFAKNFTPTELYVDKDRLVVIGNNYNDGRIQNTVKTIIFDISNKQNVKKLRETELEGSYISSRKIGSAVYLVANKNIDYYYILQQKSGDFTPAYRDTAGQDKFVNVPYTAIRYFPNMVEPNYLLVAGLDLANPDKKMEVSTYLGSGQNIFASQDNLYVAVTQYETNGDFPRPGIGIMAPSILPMPEREPRNDTVVYKFMLNQGQVKYTARGEVPGTVLNQFSMDEYKGNFRVATTKGEIWRKDENTSKNNVYILDGEMKTIGKLEDIAPGEKIYSVRFMGDRGYMVTFQTVDPLFVIDLKDPKAPAILGALKIPGYSDYLHPYDENHIIGFGKDTVEMSQKDWGGNEVGKMAFYQGMKIALFDVSDVSNPVEMFKETIGDRGTDSELLRNHKALLFAKDKNLLAFPITVMEIQNKEVEYNGMPAYGQFTFQGAYVYNLDLKTGFTLKGRITHLSQEDSLKSGHDWYGSSKNVNRVLYIGNTLYTLSNDKILANDLNTLKEENSLEITQ
ncbi:MAG: beta-propeller domain-containing protein [Eubacteriales bacterium]